MPEQRHDDRETARRVSEARRLLDEPLLNEALEAIERRSIEEMLKLPMGADRKRRILTDRVRVIRAIRAHLQAIIVTGEETLRKPLRLA